MLGPHRRLFRSTTGVLSLGCVLTLGVLGCATQTAPTPHAAARTLSPDAATLIPGPDPTEGRPFATAADASAAGGGFYVPDCPGHGTYYLQPNGAVIAVFHGNDIELFAAPASSGITAGPIRGNSVVAPRQLTAQGQVAYGYEATPQIVQTASGREEGVLEHSYLTWANKGSTMQMASKSQASLAALRSLADSCS